jgi:hypothetical protein
MPGSQRREQLRRAVQRVALGVPVYQPHRAAPHREIRRHLLFVRSPWGAVEDVVAENEE